MLPSLSFDVRLGVFFFVKQCAGENAGELDPACVPVTLHVPLPIEDVCVCVMSICRFGPTGGHSRCSGLHVPRTNVSGGGGPGQVAECWWVLLSKD